MLVSEGSAPLSDSEVAIPVKLAERMEVKIGDEISVSPTSFTTESPKQHSFTISGLVTDPREAFSNTAGVAVFTLDGMAAYADPAASSTGAVFESETVILGLNAKATNAEKDSVRDSISSLVGERPVQTTAQAAETQLQQISGEARILTYMVLAFAALALIVASLVISNTFQVLVAQRAHTLALLRCVGADKKQIKRSVLTEALILGVASSVAGILSGVLLVQTILWVVAGLNLTQSIPTAVSITPAAIWVPLVAGTVVTVLASLVPARIATRVSPLAALRPQEGDSEVRSRAGKVRLTIALLMVLSGAALFVYAFSVRDSDLNIALAVGILGGALSFVGLIVSSVLWVPAVVSAVGSGFKRFGAAAQLAASNTIRNPRRTASTSTALFIGVTLVSMLSIGASSARSTMNNELNAQFPIDIVVQNFDSKGFTPEAVNAINQVEGVEESATLDTVDAGFASDQMLEYGYLQSGRMYRASQELTNVVRDPSILESLTDDSFLRAYWSDVEKGQSGYFYAPSDEDTPESLSDKIGTDSVITLTAGDSAGLDGAILTSATFDRIVDSLGLDKSTVTPGMMFIKVTDIKDAKSIIDEIRDVLGEDNVQISGAAAERISFEQIIDVMLLVLVGLLGVAVLIALIGVANTLSLSIIERRRENATLRAVGMSKRQLRSSLAFEVMLIAGIGALVGVLLGAIYAYLGTQILLGGFGTLVFTVRWLDIALIFVVALGAGLLASILPGRSAARTSPVEALAVD